jgi:hypothetical protein
MNALAAGKTLCLTQEDVLHLVRLEADSATGTVPLPFPFEAENIHLQRETEEKARQTEIKLGATGRKYLIIVCFRDTKVILCSCRWVKTYSKVGAGLLEASTPLFHQVHCLAFFK